MFARKLLGGAVILAVAMLCSPDDTVAQRRGLRIGGPNGLVIGGGNGFRAGGRNGVQFGGGEGARFGPRGTGVQFGRGVGARFGPDVQFGGRYRNGYAAPNYGSGVYPAAPSGTTAGNVNAEPTMNAPTPMRSPNQSTVSTEPEMIVLQYPESEKRSLNYTINGTPFQLAPGNAIRMQSGLSWEVGLPGKNGKSNSFKLDEAGTFPITKTPAGWVVEGEPESPVQEESESPVQEEPIVAPTPVVDSPQVAKEAVKPAAKSDVEPAAKSDVEPAAKSDVEPAVFNEDLENQPPAPEMKSILEHNKN